jgi:hypothetical protein
MTVTTTVKTLRTRSLQRPRRILAVLTSVSTVGLVTALASATPASATTNYTWASTTASTTGLSPSARTNPQVSIIGLSCTAAGSCVAIGDYTDSTGNQQGLIETLSSGTWTAITAPTTGLSPAAGTDPEAYLASVSCSGTGSCVATGDYTDSAGNRQGLIETLSSGTWTAITAPTTGLSPAAGTDPEAYLASVSCPGAGACVAVGIYDDSSQYQYGLIETLSSGTWTATTAPTTGLSPAARTTSPGPDVFPEALSCPTVGSCAAVGYYSDSSGHPQGLLENLSSGTWTPTTAPTTGLSPAAGTDPGVYIESLSCPTTGSCVATGTYNDSSGHGQGLIETLSSGTWTPTTAPLNDLNPGARNNPQTYLNAVSCPGAGSCVATGYYTDSSNNGEGLIETLSSGTWTSTTVPISGLSPAAGTDPGVYMDALSCPSVGSCVATGYYTDPSGNQQGLFESLSSGTWTSTTVPMSGLSPTAGTDPGVYLDAMSCPATGSCVAVGNYTDSSGNQQGLIESLSSGTWTSATAPISGLSPTAGTDPQMYLEHTSCPTTGSCVAVGHYTDSSGNQQGLIETLSSGTWTSATAPVNDLSPAAGTNPRIYFDALSCPATGSCVAVGYYTDSSGNQQGLIETLSGTTWTTTTAPTSGLNPPVVTTRQVSLLALSCPTTGSCVAVGWYEDSSQHVQGLIETLSSGVWTPTAAPTTGLNPAAAANPEAPLYALSCPATGSCVAVGTYDGPSLHVYGLVETLSGTTWTATTTPMSGLSPAAGTNPATLLSAISCPAATSCVVTGYYEDTSGNQQGLIETLSGTTWTVSNTALSGLSPEANSSTPEAVLWALSCPATGSCVAVGRYTDSSGYVQGLVETLSGTTWTPTTTPTSGLDPSASGDPDAYFGGLSCPATGSCVAAGGYADYLGNVQGLVETLSGTTWTPTTAPVIGLDPAAGTIPDVTLNDVSCPAAGWCVAVGYYADSFGNQQGLIETGSTGGSSGGGGGVTPGAPTGLTATSGNTKVSLSWNAPSSEGSSPITGYDVYEGTSSGGESTTAVNSTSLVTSTSYTATGLTNGTKYYFIVEALNDVGSSPPSNEASSTPVAALPVQRIYGTDAIGTAIAVSQAEFPTADSAKAVVLARSDFFSDALAGGPLAAKVGGPLLITPGTPSSSGLDPRVQAEIQRVLPAGDTIYILGGDQALSTDIDSTLQGLGYATLRVAGADEYATAVDVAEQLGNPSVVFEATGLLFPDALSAVPAAIAKGGAILLTDGTTQAPETAAYLAAHTGDTRYAIGGPLAAYGADPTANPVYGQDLYGTSAAVAGTFFAKATFLGAATGVNYPDALSGGVFMGTRATPGPMLLVQPSGPLPPSIATYLSDTASTLTQGYLFGGPMAVGNDVLSELQSTG